jgi:hypothetical protein
MSELLRDFAGNSRAWPRSESRRPAPSSAALGRPSQKFRSCFGPNTTRRRHRVADGVGSSRARGPLPVAKCKRLIGLATQARRNIAKVNADFQRAAVTIYALTRSPSTGA